MIFHRVDRSVVYPFLSSCHKIYFLLVLIIFVHNILKASLMTFLLLVWRVKLGQLAFYEVYYKVDEYDHIADASSAYFIILSRRSNSHILVLWIESAMTV